MRGGPLPGEGVSRLNQARKRAKKRWPSHVSLQSANIENVFRPCGRSNQLRLSVRDKKIRGLDPSRARRSNRHQYPRTYITDDSRGIRYSRVPKYTEQRREWKKKRNQANGISIG